MPTWPSPRSERLGTPNIPAIRFTRGTPFGASLVRICYGLSGCSPPWTDLTGFPQPPGAFTSRLPAGQSPFPPLDMTTTATGLLCWRDFHPQEWQLASLHQIRACTANALGSYLEYLTLNRWFGHGCSTRGDGRNRLISRTIRSHVSRCRWLRRRRLRNQMMLV